MSNYPNGQPYYPGYGYAAQPSSNNQYATADQTQQGMRRTSSFDAGDDTQMFEHGQNPRGNSGYSVYGQPANTQAQTMRHPSVAGQANLPYRQPTQSSLGGYQHQQYQAPAASYAPYNPAQYQNQGQPQYNPQSYGSPQPSYSSSAYQPYIPAAYQDSTMNRNASVHNNFFSTASPPQSFGQSPPLPGRADSYQSSTGHSYTITNTGSYSQSYPSYTNVPQTSVTSPPPPPPPHLESHVTNRAYSHSGSIYQDNYGSHPSQYNDATSAISGQPSPDINRNHSSASRVSNISSPYTTSSYPSIPTPPSRNPSHHSPQRSNTLERHPQGRTLPGLPSESESEHEYSVSPAASRTGYDDLMNHLDAAIVGSSGSTATRTSTADPLFSSTSPQIALSPDERPTHLNGIVTTGDHNINYGAFSNDSDAEAAAGLAAMQAADEQEAAEEARRHSTQMRSSESNPRISDQERSDESDFGGYDLSLAGGGYAGTMHYGDDPQISHYAAAAAAVPQNNDYFERLNPRMSSVRSSGVSSEGRASQTSGFESIPPSDSMHPFPYPPDVARVDAGGTGGLTEPSPHPRRLSYEDGDETHLMEPEPTPSPSKESIPDLFFHPGMNPQRPLPPPPSSSDPGQRNAYLAPSGAYTHQARYSAYEQVPRIHPPASDTYQQEAQSPSAVPRSLSLASSRQVTRSEHPNRSNTDTDRARSMKQAQADRPFSDIYDIASTREDIATLDLPAIPRKKFDPSKLSTEQFRRCAEPWAMSSILAWIKELAEEETDLKEQTIQEAVAALFTSKVPTMNTIEAESLSEKLVKDMFAANVLIRDEEWVKFGSGTMSGVIFQLTGIGCYSSKLHLYKTKGRCYAYQCMRTLKKVDLSLPSVQKESVWHEYYNLKKEDWEAKDKKEVERQNVLHEVVTSEETYLGYLDVVRVLYRDQLSGLQPPIISAKRMSGFLRDVFGLIDKVKKVNEDFLLAHLKYRQNEQGPWVVGYSDIFREWIRRARSVYVEYAAAYPRADWLVRDEEKRNMLFKQFLDKARQDPRSSRLTWDSHLKSPITRIQRYILLLESAMKLMKQDSEERTNLAYAIDEIRAAAHEADVRVAENNKKVELSELSRKIKLRRPMEREVDLALDHLGRAVIIRGDLQRQGGKGINWVDTHAILFDHYLVLAKLIVQRDSSGMQRQEVYDVSKSPIPMDLIVLESTNDPAVMRSSMRGIAAVSTTVVPRATQSGPDPRLARTTSGASGGSGSLQHTNTGFTNSTNTSASVVTTTVLEPSNSKEDKILYPFRLKHLGKTEVYTLYAPTAEKRQEWCEAIISAKTQHAEALFAQNAEPFKLRVLADTAFGSEGYGYTQRRIIIKGTPLDRAIKEAEKRYSGQGRPAPICRSAVNCATVFHQPQDRLMCAIGTDSGVYISEYQNPRGWIRSIQMNRVTQIAVLEEFNLFILLSEKALIAYHLDVICPPSGPPVPQTDASARKAPQKLSGSKDVGFFVAGKMKDRALVFYQKKEGINSIFKVLEPVLQKSATSRSRWLGTSGRRGQTEFFREYDEFYIPSETYSLNLFHSSLAVSTKRGVEVLTLDKKNAWGVPNLRSDSPETQAHLSSIATRIKDLRPLGMFRLSDAEFLVTFEECAVYVNKHGDISRGVVMEFVGKACNACLYGAYLILFNEDFVEIRDAQNGRLKQVIAGKELRMLDDGGNAQPGSAQVQQASLGGGVNGLAVQGFNAPRTVKVAMQHPEYEKSYVLVELLLATEKQ